jgi:hypothetical protein
MPPPQYWFTRQAIGSFWTGASALGYAWYRAAQTEMDSSVVKAETDISNIKLTNANDAGYATVSVGFSLKNLGPPTAFVDWDLSAARGTTVSRRRAAGNVHTFNYESTRFRPSGRYFNDASPNRPICSSRFLWNYRGNAQETIGRLWNALYFVDA